MPPVLDPSKSKVDGLAFLGLSLTRNSKHGHSGSETHQQSFDLDSVQDRKYEFLFSTNDDGWLVGGGEPGPPTSYKLAAKDSAHVEIMRIGTYVKDWGGLPQDFVVETLKRGEILIPEITVVPTAVVANSDVPPELEIRFDMPTIPNFENPSAPLPVNWQLRFLQNQLFHKFQFPSRFTPGAFHSTIVRKAEFRSDQTRQAYFAKCRAVCHNWMERGAKPLVPKYPLRDDITVVKCARREPKKAPPTPTPSSPAKAQPLNKSPAKPIKEDPQDQAAWSEDEDEEVGDYYQSGIWLFTDRNTITHRFLPNFLPPYDAPVKKKLILEVLKEEWDEKALSWKDLTKLEKY